MSFADLIDATEFSFDSGDQLNPVTANLTMRAGQGPHRPLHDTWAVRWRGRCLDADGEWVFEPQPSSRDEAFYARHRFDFFTAIGRARAAARREHAILSRATIHR